MSTRNGCRPIPPARPDSQRAQLHFGASGATYLHSGASDAKLAPCRVSRSKTCRRILTASCVSALRARISRYRNICGVGSSPKPVSQRLTRFSLASRPDTAAPFPSTSRRTTFGQNVIVADASVLAVALADDGQDGELARRRLAGETLAAPELVDLEVVSVLRRHVAARRMTARRADEAISDLAELPVERSPHRPLLRRIWQLRHVATPYDAAYIALAEALGATLVTADRRLSRAPGVRCEVELLSRRS